MKRNQVRRAFEQRALADRQLLELIRITRTELADPQCSERMKAFAADIAAALEWWIASGFSGQEVPRPQGMSAIEGIVKAWKGRLN
jgi:hypothetical protein